MYGLVRVPDFQKMRKEMGWGGLEFYYLDYIKIARFKPLVGHKYAFLDDMENFNVESKESIFII